MSDTAFFQLVLSRFDPNSAEAYNLLNPPLLHPAINTHLSETHIHLPPRPPPGNAYNPSPFRPHCLPSERLSRWTTPLTAKYRRGSADATAVIKVQISSLEEETRSNYGAGLLLFTQYCDSRNISEEARMPASETLLCGFATVMGARQASGSTVDNWLEGLAFWHELNGAPWLGGNSLRNTIGGISKLAPQYAQR